MIFFLALLATAALIGIVGAVLDLVRDGYRRLPSRPEAVWAVRPAEPVGVELDPTRS